MNNAVSGKVAASRTGGPPAAETLAAYAVALRFDEIPGEVVQHAGDILSDAVACSLFGARFAWSRIVAEHLAAAGGRAEVAIGGFPGLAVGLHQAPLLMGTMCHAYELDSLRSPGAGVHAGATVAMPAFAHALADPDLSPRRIATAIVAGCEVMHRIGLATLHSPETAGFHAPGLTGVFGAATVHGVLRGATARQLAYAYGIAGSLAGGLMAFARSDDGGMIKRLHLGRAAEGGFLAVDLAMRGFEGPSSVLEGPFGVLDAFCPQSDPDLLTATLGQEWETLRTCFKRYAAHITAHGPIEKIREIVAEQGIGPDDVARMELRVSDKVLSHHNITAPADIMAAQYSTPFMAAVALHLDIDDPGHIGPGLLDRADIRKTLERITLAPIGAAKGWQFGLGITLKSGARILRESPGFSGADAPPEGLPWLDRKFALLTEGVPGARPWLDCLDRLKNR